MKILVIYYSTTGNTEKMAELIKKGINETNEAIEVNLKTVEESGSKDIEESDFVLLGCSAMGSEEIDTVELEPFLNENESLFNNKSIALFGSYGWGDGEWLESWQELMEEMGANIKLNSLMVMEEPDDESEEECVDFGKNIAKLL